MKKARWAVLAAVLTAGGLALFLKARPGLDASAKQPALRIVSLSPNITEILFAVGAGEMVVGATDYCDYPPEAKRIPRVGGLGRPNIETLLAMKPDCVIASNLDLFDEVRRLGATGARMADIPIRNFEELFAAIERIGEITDRPDAARELVAKLRGELAEAEARWRDVPPEKRPGVFLEFWSDPLGTAGRKSFLNEVVARAGGRNVARGIEQEYPIISPEQVVEWDPDVIVLCYMLAGPEAGESLKRRIGWGRIKAVRNGRIIMDIPADLLLRPGPRLTEGVRLLAERLYPVPAGAERVSVPASGANDRNPHGFRSTTGKDGAP